MLSAQLGFRSLCPALINYFVHSNLIFYALVHSPGGTRLAIYCTSSTLQLMDNFIKHPSLRLDHGSLTQMCNTGTPLFKKRPAIVVGARQKLAHMPMVLFAYSSFLTVVHLPKINKSSLLCCNKPGLFPQVSTKSI